MKLNQLLSSIILRSGLGIFALMGVSGCLTNGDPMAQFNRFIGGGGNVGTRQSSSAQNPYLYFPDYDVYYNRDTRQFFSVENNRWVVGYEPRNVSARRVLASQAMSLDGYRSPDEHRNAYDQENRYQRAIRPGNWNTSWNAPDRRTYR